MPGKLPPPHPLLLARERLLTLCSTGTREGIHPKPSPASPRAGTSTAPGLQPRRGYSGRRAALRGREWDTLPSSPSLKNKVPPEKSGWLVWTPWWFREAARLCVHTAAHEQSFLPSLVSLPPSIPVSRRILQNRLKLSKKSPRVTNNRRPQVAKTTSEWDVGKPSQFAEQRLLPPAQSPWTSERRTGCTRSKWEWWVKRLMQLSKEPQTHALGCTLVCELS